MKKLLVANRSEIALRIFHTAQRMGLATVAVYSAADAASLHVKAADQAICIGPGPSAESYLAIDKVIAAARTSGADAIHPGYGFLAENAEFADAVLAAGLTWVGPTPASMRAMGNKAGAKRLLVDKGVPMLPGYSGTDQSDATLFAEATKIGTPLMIKAAAGGGGRGMRLVIDLADFAAQLTRARSEALAGFGSDEMILERALLNPKHVEVQVFGDAFGHIIHLGERDCSVQRRNQKIIEEAPSPALNDSQRQAVYTAALNAARAVNYEGAGTMEFLLEGDYFYFMEMNTRLQVEHPVTEALTGLDLVELQLRVARKEPLDKALHGMVAEEGHLARLLAGQPFVKPGHAIEVRLCAEDPTRDFMPQAGEVTHWHAPAHTRVETALHDGAVIPPFYDSMIAKLITHASSRDDARAQLARALEETVVTGIPTNQAFLATLLRDEVFAAGAATTKLIESSYADPASRAAPATPEVLQAAARALADVGAARHPAEWRHWSNVADREAVFSLKEKKAEEVHLVRFSSHSPVARGYRTFVHNHQVTVQHGAASWCFVDVTNAPPVKKSNALKEGRLTAPMNGKLAYIAAPGLVKANTPLAVVEAMKMEHPLVLPADVTVTIAHVVQGTQVAPMQLLVEFKPVEAV